MDSLRKSGPSRVSRRPNALAEALETLPMRPRKQSEARFAMRHINHVRYLLTGWFTLDEIVERRQRIVILGVAAGAWGARLRVPQTPAGFARTA